MKKISSYLNKNATNGLAGLMALRLFSEELLTVAEKVQNYCTKKLGWKYLEDRVSVEGKAHTLWIDQRFDAEENSSKQELNDIESKIKQQLGVKVSIVDGREISVLIGLRFPTQIEKD